MAFAALVSLAQTIDLILNYHQDSISPQFKNQIKSIHKYVIVLKAFLVDFPKEAYRLEEIIREQSYAAEDNIESVLSELIQTKAMRDDPSHRFPELENVRKRIESIAKEVMEKDKETVIGFEKHLTKIRDPLIRPGKREVFPIFGTGGIGKTTLARYVYNDPLIMEHFDIRGWVTVSQNYSVPEIEGGLLVSIEASHAKSYSIKEHNVYQNLFGRRYLIVLDDVWSRQAWDDLSAMFPDFHINGSRIIITTRDSDVADYVNSSSNAYEMCLMDEIQSWHLLRQKVFKQDNCPVKLESIGKEIATSCRGLPLAIVVISGLLSTVDQTEAAWGDISRNVMSTISANEQLRRILSLSYSYLPHFLRPCFLYLGGFPEDYQMPVSKLIKLWVAEGFLKPNDPKSFEETAGEYLKELVKRSLVTVTKWKHDGTIKRFSMHDLMREMCIKKAQEENFFVHVRGSLGEGIDILRRVSIIHSDLDFLEKYHGSTIHTVICLEDRQQGTQCSLEYLGWLRILDLIDAFEYFYKNDSSSTSLPSQLFELFHLRYLAFDYPFSIPAAISNLRNLQTLIISSSNYHEHYVQLPAEIWRMPQLRHLVILSCVLPGQEGSTCVLEDLQTLSKAVNLICSKVILKMIPRLKKLQLFYTVWRDYEADYQLYNLEHLQALEDLKIEMYNFPEKQPSVRPAFPNTLKKLTLRGLRLPWEDMNIVGSLTNLEVLKLRDDAFVGDTWETTEGEFPKLKFLLIEFSDLQDWITESSHFPRLKILVLHGCWDLKEIPDDIGDIPTLELIEVDDRNKYLVDWANRVQEDQQNNYSNYVLQVRCVKGQISICIVCEMNIFGLVDFFYRSSPFFSVVKHLASIVANANAYFKLLDNVYQSVV